MTKLTPAQEKVLNGIKSELKRYEHCESAYDVYMEERLGYLEKDNPRYNELYKHYKNEWNEYKNHVNFTGKTYEERYVEHLQDYKANRTLVHANTKTLEKLEKLGFIKIIERHANDYELVEAL